jgi:hypothetical protein
MGPSRGARAHNARHRSGKLGARAFYRALGYEEEDVKLTKSLGTLRRTS